MSFEYLADPQRPAWSDQLPGRPEPYFLTKGGGEHAKLFADTFTVLVSGDETADLGADPAAGDTREAQLFGAPLSSVPDLVRQASPITYASAVAPPILLLHGEADRLIPGVQSVRLEAALRGSGTVVELETYPGADHLWMGSPEAAVAALTRTIAFLRCLLSPSAQPAST